MARNATEVGEMAMMVWKWVGKAAATKSLGSEAAAEQAASRGGIIELSDDDEISIAQRMHVMSKQLDKTMQVMSNHLRQAVMKGCGDGNNKLARKMEKHKQDIVKRKNGVGERLEQKLANTYQKMDCITAVECYNVMLSEYSVELTNSHKLANLWVYDYILRIYKSETQEVIYNQLVHPMETHDIGKVDEKTRVVDGGEELDDNYNRCILLPNNGHHLGRPPSKRIASQAQDKKVRRCSKCGEIEHTRRICRNPRADFNVTYKSDVVQIEDFLDAVIRCDQVAFVIVGSLGLLQGHEDTGIHIAALASSEAQVQPPLCRVVAVRELICVPDLTSIITCTCNVEVVWATLYCGSSTARVTYRIDGFYVKAINDAIFGGDLFNA
ncbi:LOW QUALITY PROTEIN: hypothetical protein Cgig2_032205 [Carnegiea gigantea]|uniref:Uncharacterized protein n=1 Tax=Carnegiea gigantea TaxID=171969 RepID=A0A9Q1K3Z1_9CARY|nr:LOW QUALITY PROTEIN: hypothetical protein Cgig2_032205 [Carnegiea gigantea]